MDRDLNGLREVADRIVAIERELITLGRLGDLGDAAFTSGGGYSLRLDDERRGEYVDRRTVGIARSAASECFCAVGRRGGPRSE
jgi:hypothetical protein